MPVESLEEVRLLSNLETGQHKLINIMLFGQPELDTLLADPKLRQVRDRVIHRFELLALQAEEASAYIDHRLRAAGWHGARLISATALARLVKASGGRARRINLLADKALLAAYAQGERSVEGKHVNSAVQELPIGQISAPVKKVYPWRLLGLSFAMALVMSAGVVGLLGWYREAGKPVAVVSPKPQPIVVAPLALEPPVATASLAPLPAISEPAAEPKPAPVAAVTPIPAGVIAVDAAPTDMHLDAVLARTRSWVQQANLDGFTIQLVALKASASPEHYLDLAAKQLDPSKVYAQYSIYNGTTYISVFLGHFETVRAAALAIEELPASLKSNRPLVRSWTKIKQEQTP
jgi:hypothetical protein